MYIQLYKPGYFHPLYRYLVEENSKLDDIIAFLDSDNEAKVLKNRGYMIYVNWVKDNKCLGEYK